MIRPLNDEEKIEYSKLRLNHPYKLLWIWIFSFDAVMKDFEYILESVTPTSGKAIYVMLFLIPVYLIMIIWKISEYCVSWFSYIASNVIDNSFEYVCCIAIYVCIVWIRIPYAIYTYMRFNRATALIYMLKSD